MQNAPHVDLTTALLIDISLVTILPTNIIQPVAFFLQRVALPIRVKMDESPLPEYLVDMLREAGHVDKDGKPLNDPFNPWDDEEMEGSRTERERLIKEQEVGRGLSVCVVYV